MNPDRILLMFACVMVFTVGAIVGNIVGINAVEMQAVKHGAAQYNPQSGCFEWLEREQPGHDHSVDVRMQIERARQENWKCE